ncbi:MAG: hypothetical protein GC168_08500 [Candidatus Hydrogenedens sp.]|nr:hypothetical protein [Candidatus Hydrogenedens sp.]
MIPSFVIVFATVLGLSVWVPRLPLGARLFVAAAAVPLLLFLSASVAGLSVTAAAWLLAGLAAAGLITGALGLMRQPPPMAALAHPALMLPVLCLTIAALHGQTDYLPHSWDEFSNWLYWARQAFVADAAWRPDMYFSTTGYPPGWPLAIAYPQVFFGDFVEARAVPLALLLHTGLLGLLYDAFRHSLPETIGAGGAQRWGWVLVLLLTAAEAFWKLLPESLLIDEPVTQVLAGCFGLALLAVALPERRLPAAVALGMVAAAAYALKIIALIAVPALGLGALALAWLDGAGRPWRARAQESLRLLAVMLVPLFVVHLAWSLVNPAGSATCAPPVAQALLIDLPGPTGATLRAVGHHMIAESLTFLTVYKLPVTVLALAGLGLSLRSRWAIVTAMAVTFLAAFLFAQWLAYAYCFSPYERDILASLSRYLRAPVRILHGIGLFLLFRQALLFWYRRLRTRRPIAAAAAVPLVLVLALGTFQVRAVGRSADAITTRAGEDPVDIARVLALRTRTAELRAALDRAGLSQPLVTLIAQGSDGIELMIIRYFALGERPHAELRRFALSDRFSWGETARNVWMTAASADVVRARLAEADVLWPYRLDDWMRGILGGLTPDPACRATLDRQILIREPQPPARFRCVPFATPG